MKTSKEWWAEVKASPALLEDWLKDQVRGEYGAVVRIRAFIDAFAANSPEDARVLEIIACQEEQHGNWIAELLRVRGIDWAVGDLHGGRYWDKTLKGIKSFHSGAAVAAHAEKMRLERITEIASDPGAPEDIKAVFMKILPEEKFHEYAFRTMAGKYAMEQARLLHEEGMQSIGLIPAGLSSLRR